MKPLTFVGDALKELRAFPDQARQDAGYQLDLVQRGLQPDDFKPMPAVGAGVEELRIWSSTGTFRIVYLARLADAVYVLHAFQKKSQATPEGGYRPGGAALPRVDQEPDMSIQQTQTFASVWDALGDTPEQAANLRARADLMTALRAIVQREGWTQADAARRCGVSQPRMNDLLRGRISKFSLDALVNMAAAAGQRVHLVLAQA